MRILSSGGVGAGEVWLREEGRRLGGGCWRSTCGGRTRRTTGCGGSRVIRRRSGSAIGGRRWGGSTGSGPGWWRRCRGEGRSGSRVRRWGWPCAWLRISPGGGTPRTGSRSAGWRRRPPTAPGMPSARPARGTTSASPCGEWAGWRRRLTPTPAPATCTRLPGTATARPAPGTAWASPCGMPAGWWRRSTPTRVPATCARLPGIATARPSRGSTSETPCGRRAGRRRRRSWCTARPWSSTGSSRTRTGQATSCTTWPSSTRTPTAPSKPAPTTSRPPTPIPEATPPPKPPKPAPEPQNWKTPPLPLPPPHPLTAPPKANPPPNRRATPTYNKITGVE